MNTTDLIKRVRQAAYLEDTASDYTDVVILGQMYDQMLQLYERAVVKSRQGYWFQQQKVTAVAGQATYAIPSRAILNSVERIQIAYDNTIDFVDLLRVDETFAINYELGAGQLDRPARYIMRGRNIQLLPTPDNGNYTLRFEYYCRPSRLVAPQATLTAGQITAVNDVANTVTVAASTNSIDSNGATSSMASGTWVIDVVGGAGSSAASSTTSDIVDNSGWHDFVVSGQTATVAANVWTFADSTIDLSPVQPGDYVRAAGQIEWPQISSDFHRTIADATANKILVERRMTNPDLQQAMSDDLERFRDLLQPRALNTAGAIIVSPASMYRGVRRMWPAKYP